MAHLHNPVDLALIGRRVRYSGPYGSASGLIYATHAHTEPATVPGVSRYRIAAGGLQPIERGPVESVDLVLDDNRTMQRFPWHMITVLDGAPHNGHHPVLMLDTFGEEAEIAELLANAARAKAEAAAKETEEQARFTAEVQRLKAAHPELIQPDGTTSRAVTAAKNCRVLLKAAFPGVKFSVRSGRATYSSTLDIKWTDGPTPAQVEAVTDQFKGGFFDGMADIYESRDTPFTAAFGDADYVSATRERSDALILRTIAHIAEKYGEKDRPTLDDYHAGRCNRTSPLENETWGNWSWSDLIYRTSREIDASTPAPAAAPAEVREEAETISLDEFKARAAPELITHTTKRGKVLTGIIRSDLTREQAEQIDPYTFHKAGGWFIRARHLDNGSAE